MSLVRIDELRRRLDELYRHYDHRFVTPDPLEFVRAEAEPRDREVVGLLASSLAFGTVGQIKKSIGVVLEALGPGPASAVLGLDPRALSEGSPASGTAGATGATSPVCCSSRDR